VNKSDKEQIIAKLRAAISNEQIALGEIKNFSVKALSDGQRANAENAIHRLEGKIDGLMEAINLVRGS